MKKLTYIRKALALAIWIPVVIILFRVIPDRKLAASIAGVGFILLPGLFLLDELKSSKPNKFVIFSLVQFLILFALPILYLRLSNWNAEFNSLSLFGISANTLHKYSNVSYAFALLAVGIASYQDNKKKRQPLD